MKITSTHFLSPTEVPYKIDGKNLRDFRRAGLRVLAKRLEVDPSGSKNDIVIRVIAKLDAIGAPHELTELAQFENPGKPPEVGGGSEEVPVRGQRKKADNRGRKKSRRPRSTSRRNRPSS